MVLTGLSFKGLNEANMLDHAAIFNEENLFQKSCHITI